MSTRTRISTLARCLAAALLAVAAVATPAAAQDDAVSLERIVQPLRAGLSGAVVLNAIRGRCIDFRVDDPQARRALVEAGADEAFLRELSGFCYQAVLPPDRGGTTDGRRTATAATISPGGAAVRSALVPGLGQFQTGRPVIGAVFLAAAGGALAAGVLSESVTVYCTAPTTDRCAPENVADEDASPRLALGIAGFVAVAAISAIEAYAGANRSNTARALRPPERDTRVAEVRVAPPAVHVERAGVRFELVRLRF